ncbi:MAG: prepilin peptidase [Patescibacteria group bacterium]|nr:prepilin peptidase [Patescibacteria group bacterium]
MEYFLVFYFGCIIGSFLNVVILRLPKEEGLNGRSYCFSCGHALSWVDLFPLFSYLCLFGKCRYCKKTFSPRYFLIELVTGLLFLAAFIFLKPDSLLGYLALLKYAIALSALVVVFMVDLEHLLIFDNVLLAAGLPVLAINVLTDYMGRYSFLSLSGQTMGGLFAGGLFAGIFFLLWLVSKGAWIGFGDVKLMLVLGLVLGWPVTAAAWLLAYFLGTAFALPLLVLGKKHLSSRLPFGCFLSVAAALCLFYGQQLIAWYLRYVGF